MGAESKIEKAVTKWAKENGFYARKFRAPSNRGVPDHLYLSPSGVVVFMEFKAPGKLPTPLQQREIDFINRNNGHAFWVDSIEEGKEILRKASKGVDSKQ